MRLFIPLVLSETTYAFSFDWMINQLMGADFIVENGRSVHPSTLCLDNDRSLTLESCLERGSFDGLCKDVCSDPGQVCVGSSFKMETMTRCTQGLCFGQLDILSNGPCEEMTTWESHCVNQREMDCSSAKKRDICGSDKEKYESECAFQKAGCFALEELKEMDEDFCQQANFIILHSLQNLFNWAPPVEECIEVCETEFVPVCGTDEQTYTNVCELKKKSCEESVEVKVSYEGKCECPQACLSIYLPVCGSDNVSYDNACELTRAACKGLDKLVIVHKGACDGIARYMTLGGAKPRPISPRPCGGCAKTYSPVCASDGESYISPQCFEEHFCRRPELTKPTIVDHGWCNREDEDRYWGRASNSEENNDMEFMQRPILQRPIVYDPNMDDAPVYKIVGK